jgi:protein SCO1/2
VSTGGSSTDATPDTARSSTDATPDTAGSSADATPDTAESSTDARAPSSGFGYRLGLPIIVLVVVIAGVTLLLIGGSGKPTLPGNASTAKLSGFRGLALNPPQQAPPLDTLRNYDGSSFSLAAQRGKAAFVTFLYSHCPDVCPLIASNLHNAYASMPQPMRSRVAIVAVSVDPHGDSAGAVASFVRQHQLTGEARYLIGSAQQLPPVWEAWKVGSQKDASNPGLVNHSALIYGVGANGKIYTIYPANFQPSDIVHDVPPLLNQ